MLRSLFALVVACSFAAPALAIKPFQEQFWAEYATDTDAEFTKLVKEAKCYTCHQGRKKKNRNAYGQALDELLDKKTDSKDVEKIKEALKKVAEMSSNPDDDSAPTFGELIASGQLPGGSLDDAKKEPEDL